MQVTVYSTRPYDRQALEQAPGFAHHHFNFLEVRLDASTVVTAAGADAVCVFVNDQLGRPVLQALHGLGVRLVVLRCAGFNWVSPWGACPSIRRMPWPSTRWPCC